MAGLWGGGAIVAAGVSRVMVGLGSNLGDRVANLMMAVERLDALVHTDVAVVSTFLSTDPVDVVDQPEFVNAVVDLRTTLEPGDLLLHLLEIERSMGRKRDGVVPRGPREIDLDLLLWEDRCINSPGLTLPHPRMHERTFVLVSLVEIDPALVHPVLGCTMGALLEEDIAKHGPVGQRCRLLADA